MYNTSSCGTDFDNGEVAECALLQITVLLKNTLLRFQEVPYSGSMLAPASPD